MAYKDMQNIAKWQKERKKKRKRRRQMEPNIPKVLLMNLLTNLILKYNLVSFAEGNLMNYEKYIVSYQVRDILFRRPGTFLMFTSARKMETVMLEINILYMFKVF